MGGAGTHRHRSGVVLAVQFADLDPQMPDAPLMRNPLFGPSRAPLHDSSESAPLPMLERGACLYMRSTEGKKDFCPCLAPDAVRTAVVTRVSDEISASYSPTRPSSPPAISEASVSTALVHGLPRNRFSTNWLLARRDGVCSPSGTNLHHRGR